MTTQTVTRNDTTEEAARVVPPVRLAVDELVPHINKAMNALDAAARKVSLEAPLIELVRLRASQLNGCAYCVDMHSQDALTGGEDARRLFALPVWPERTRSTLRFPRMCRPAVRSLSRSLSMEFSVTPRRSPLRQVPPPMPASRPVTQPTSCSSSTAVSL